MSTMVQPNLGPPAPKYSKEDPPAGLDDPRHSHLSHQSQQPQSLHHPRSGILPPSSHPRSPHSSSSGLPHTSYAQPQLLNGGVHGLHRQSNYAPQPQEPTPYYTSHQSAYPLASAPPQYPSSEAPELMAATAPMNRPYPPIYQTPQSNSPSSVASPQTHDQNGRSLYGQPSLSQGMYSYPHYPAPPMNPISSASYAPAPQHPHLTSPPLLGGPLANPPQLPPQHSHHTAPQQHPNSINTSPRMKYEAAPVQPAPGQRTALTPSHPPPTAQSMSSTNTHASSNSNSSNTTAAPGPIPATTPLVVRQDGSGVQWIAFEYSRDRVKMEYTIRCDVENITIENLTPEFKTDNCVYPRACCPKEQYRGNRLVYETECNAVGWALAELNPCLRGKRGLIQRAVDSWRNSNQDPRLRSRRVRRMAKLNTRKAVAAQANHLAGPGGPGGPPPPVPAAPAIHPGSSMSSMGAQQLHHHHAQPDESPGHHGPDDVSGSSEYTNVTHRSPTAPSPYAPSGPPQQPPDLRLGHVLHGYPSYPPPSSMASNAHHTGPSMLPSPHDRALTHMKTSTIATKQKNKHDQNDDHDPAALFGNLPEGRRRKFILVEDAQRGSRVRVKVMLDQVDVNEIPDSYRKSNSVYPRTYVPVHGPFGRKRGPGDRDSDDDDDGGGESEEAATVGRTIVPVPMLEGEGTLGVPRISKRKRGREGVLNDLGYRMSWGQSRVFAGRSVFLQRSLDAYRNKMRSTMLTAGQEVESVSPHFETRIGKRRWQERNKRSRSTSAASGRGSGSGPVAAAAAAAPGRTGAKATSAAARDAAEVEP